MKPNASRFHIRLAYARDTSAIASLLLAAFAEYQVCYTLAAFSATTPSPAQLQTRLSEGPVWVVCQPEVLLGTLSAVQHGTGLYLRSMAVLPSARGSGIGKLLLQQAEQFARRQGYHALVLSTTPFLHQAIRLYEQVGFQQSDAGPHELYGTPLVTMVKLLTPAR